MSDEIIIIHSISQIHQLLGYEKPKHPLITLIDATRFHIPKEYIGVKFVTELYMVALKDKSCGMEYGRNSFDFEEGVMVFTGLNQASATTQEVQTGDIQGWMLYFHPDLIRGTHLGDSMDDYTFFNYEVYEALHLSADEEQIILDCLHRLKKEYEQRIDNHSQRVIVSTIELLLNYSLRYYERQFRTRAATNKDVVSIFETELKDHFTKQHHLDSGLPSIQYFARKVHLSPHYFSDLLKKETGRSAKDHINEYVIHLAKNLLLGTDHTVSKIAYDLGFNYPHYFNRLFKSKTGQTPLEYRFSN